MIFKPKFQLAFLELWIHGNYQWNKHSLYCLPDCFHCDLDTLLISPDSRWRKSFARQFFTKSKIWYMNSSHLNSSILLGLTRMIKIFFISCKLLASHSRTWGHHGGQGALDVSQSWGREWSQFQDHRDWKYWNNYVIKQECRNVI